MSHPSRHGALRRRYLKIDDTVYKSEAFRTLPGSALKLWIDLRTQFNGSNSGAISAAMSLLGHRGWVSADTLFRARRQLLERGLLALTRQGKPGPHRIASLFRFTDLQTAKNETKFIEGRDATHEYLGWTRKTHTTEIGARPLRNSEGCRSGNRNVEITTAPKIGARKNGEIAHISMIANAKGGTCVADAQPPGNRSTYKLPVGEGAGLRSAGGPSNASGSCAATSEFDPSP